MAKKHLKLGPHNIDEDTWWYEVNGGITLMIRRWGGIDQVKIPWRSIRAALKRKDRKD